MATAIVSAMFGSVFAATALGGVVAAGLGFAISYAINNFAGPDQSESGSGATSPDQGVKQRISTNTKNKIPVVYGEKRVAGQITFFDISANNQKMAFIIPLSEGSVESISDIRWDDKRLSFGGLSLTTGLRSVTDAVDGDGVSDDFLSDDRLKVRVFPTGGRCTEMETFSEKWKAGLTPSQLEAQRSMPNVAYMYLELTYDRDKRVSSLSSRLTAKVKGKLIRTFDASGNISTALTYSDNPAEALIDYLTNDTYGAGMPDTSIDFPSFYSHATFCDVPVTHTPSGGGSVSAKRYTSNGVTNTNSDIDRNVSDLTVGNSGFLTWTYGKFGIVSNKAKTSSYTFSEDNIFGTIEISKLGFDNKLNQITARYDGVQSEEEEEQVIVNAPASVMNDNEPFLERTLRLPFTNNNIEANRVATVFLNQSRQDVLVTFLTSIASSGIEAGDVITLSHENAFVNKEFLVYTVNEKVVDGIIGLEITAQEYSSTVYTSATILEYDPAPNTSLPNPYATPTVTGLDATEDITIIEPNLVITWTDGSDAITDSYSIGYRLDANPSDPLIYKSTSGGARYVLTGLELSKTYFVEITPTSTLGNEGATVNTTGATASTRSAPGASFFTGLVYLRGTSTPATPTEDDGSFNFTTRVLVPPTGWSVNAQSGTGDLYVSTGIFTDADGTVGNTVVWEDPTILSVDGQEGEDGTFIANIFRRNASRPPTPLGGVFQNRFINPPTDWSRNPPVFTDNTDLWTARATVTPVTRGTKAQETFTTNGITGTAFDTSAVAEIGFFDVSGNAGTDVTGTPESATATFNGETGVISTTAGTKEITNLSITGSTAGSDVGNVPGSVEETDITFSGTVGVGTLTADESFPNIPNLKDSGPDNFDIVKGIAGDGTNIVVVGLARLTNNSRPRYIATNGIQILQGDDIGAIDVTYGNGTFVTVGGTIGRTSTDGGSTFTERTIPVSVTRVFFLNNLFIATGNNGALATSTDGISWTSRVSGQSTIIRDVTFSNGTFVLVSDGGISSSTNGLAWTTRDSGAFLQVTHNSTTFVAVGVGGLIRTSNNGTSWTLVSSGTTENLHGVEFLQNTFVICGSDGTILTSSNGSSWVSRTSGISSILQRASELNGIILLVGSGSAVIRSTDAGATWSTQSVSSLVTDVNLNINKVVNGSFYIGGDFNTLFRLFQENPALATITFDSSHASSPVLINLVPNSGANGMAAQVRTIISSLVSAGTITGLTVVAGTNETVELDATIAGERLDISVSLSGELGTAEVSIVVQQQGTNDSKFRTSYRITSSGLNHSPSFLVGTFANDATPTQAITQVRNNFVANEIGGYSEDAISGDAFNVTSDTPVAEQDLTFEITVVGTGGDLVLTRNVTTQGVDPVTSGTATSWTVVAEGAAVGNLFTTFSDATSQASQISTVINAGNFGFTASANVGVLTLTSVSRGNKTDYQISISTNGTDQTATQPVVVNTEGTPDRFTRDSLSFQFAVGSATTYTFVNSANAGTMADTIASDDYVGVDLIRNDTFDVGNNPLGSGNARVVFTYDSAGVEADVTLAQFVVNSGDTSGTLDIPQVVITTQGADSFSTPGSSALVSFGSNSNIDDLTVIFTDASNANSQASQLSAEIDLVGILEAAASSNVVTVDHLNSGSVVPTVVYTNSGTGSTATNPTTNRTVDGVDSTSTLTFWGQPYLTGQNADSQNFIFRVAGTRPVTPDPSAGVPVDWSDTSPDNPTNIVWFSLGIRKVGEVNYTWQAVQQFTPVDGVNGRNGAGRYFKLITGRTSAPEVGTATFTNDANQLIVDRFGIGAVATDGDTVTIEYLLVGGSTFVRDAIYNSDNDLWLAFAFKIDGSLLVNGTVVAEALLLDGTSLRAGPGGSLQVGSIFSTAVLTADRREYIGFINEVDAKSTSVKNGQQTILTLTLPLFKAAYTQKALYISGMNFTFTSADNNAIGGDNSTASLRAFRNAGSLPTSTNQLVSIPQNGGDRIDNYDSDIRVDLTGYNSGDTLTLKLFGTDAASNPRNLFPGLGVAIDAKVQILDVDEAALDDLSNIITFS